MYQTLRPAGQIEPPGGLSGVVLLGDHLAAGGMDVAAELVGQPVEHAVLPDVRSARPLGLHQRAQQGHRNAQQRGADGHDDDHFNQGVAASHGEL